MTKIEEIIQLKIKPKEKQEMLVDAVISNKIPAEKLILFFETASDVDKGTCADVIKHVSAKKPEVIVPFIDILVHYINYKAPRVKWGVPEAVGNMSKVYPDEMVKAIPFLLENTKEDKINTTVIKWCSAYALTEIAKYNPKTRKQLIPLFERSILEEKNNGVKNLYIKALKAIEK